MCLVIGHVHAIYFAVSIPPQFYFVNATTLPTEQAVQNAGTTFAANPWHQHNDLS